MMNWTGKKVVVIGAARQGLALARYLAQKGAQVVLNDQRPVVQLEAARQALADLPPAAQARLTWVCGGHPLGLLDDADLVCPSGGVPLELPLVLEAQRRGVPLSNDSQIFLQECPCRTIGITGSAGKTTTTTLLGRMARLAGQAWVGGNIGSPLLSVVDEMQPGDLAVIELSSFQLEIMSLSTDVAVVLNITPNHLDRHSTMEAYTAAKARLVTCQSAGGVAVLGRDDPGAWALRNQAAGQVVSFGMQRPPHGEPGAFVQGEMIYWWDGQAEMEILPLTHIHLRGAHNVQNVLAACAAGISAGLLPEHMQAALDGFSGVPHRLEFVGEWGGAAWYNDTIASAPERSMAAIRSFDEPIVLLAGGRDKNLPWEDFAALVHQRVDHLILFGEAAEKIAQAVGSVQPGSRPYSIQRCAGLQQAVWAAARVIQPGDVVLLSPGGTSFDEFRDFEERGEVFRKWVSELS